MTNIKDIQEGDTVEAVKGTRRVRDVVARAEGPLFNHALYLGTPSLIGPSSLTGYEQQGFTLTVIEKAKPKLPEEPGVYLSGTNAATQGVLRLTTRGEWFWTGNMYNPIREPLTKELVQEHHAPLTKLEPVAETAKKVLERFQEVHAGAFVTVEEVAAQLAAEFGVTA